MPLISILAPHKNEPTEWLQECIQSVQVQSFMDWELLIIDDCSDKAPILNTIDSRIILIARTHSSGIVDCNNIGAGYAKGQWLMPFSCNDQMMDGCLSDLARLTKEFPDSAAIGTNSGYWGKAILKDVTLGGCCLISRKWWDKMGGYVKNPEYLGQGLEDWHMWIRLWQAGASVAVSDKYLINHRQHANAVDSIVGTKRFSEIRDWIYEQNKIRLEDL